MLTALLAAALQMAPAPACTTAAPLPIGLTAWDNKGGSVPTIGQRASLTLKPMAEVELRTERMDGADTFAGIYPLIIQTTGTYRVALSAGAWIEVLGPDDKAVQSVAHQPGPACSGIRKIVDFALAPGKYSLQLSGAKTVAIDVLIVQK